MYMIAYRPELRQRLTAARTAGQRVSHTAHATGKATELVARIVEKVCTPCTPSTSSKSYLRSRSALMARFDERGAKQPRHISPSGDTHA
jgi:hypothetical protein